MPNTVTISEFTFNNGSTYVFKDAVARAAIDNLNSFEYTVCTSASNTPKDITWNDITGTLNPSEDTKYRIYLVPSTNGTDDIYDEYLTIQNGNEYLWEKIGNTDVNLGNYALKDETVSDVQVNGTSVVTNGVANVPVASDSRFGVVKIDTSFGTGVSSGGHIMLQKAFDTRIRLANSDYMPIVPSNQHQAVFYGLARAAGDTTQPTSNNVFGTYTDEAKSAIRTMIGAASVEDIPDAPVQDVQVNGVSVLDQNGTANVPIGGAQTFGVFKTESNWGINHDNGKLFINSANDTQLKAGIDAYRPIVPMKQHQSVFYGLAKAAGDTTQSQSSNAVGTYTSEAKSAIRNMVGAVSEDIISVQDTQPTSTDNKLWIAETPTGTVQVPTVAEMNSALDGKVGKGDYASATEYGIVKVNSGNGIYVSPSDGCLSINPATNDMYKAGTANYRVATPAGMSSGTFYGLAKAAGDTTQSQSDNAVGTYTNDAKTAIRTMLGTIGDVQINGSSVVQNGTASIPKATDSTLGVMTAGQGLFASSTGAIVINKAQLRDIKRGDGHYLPIVTVNQHEAVFYGLAKVAGADMASSDNPVGTYTDAAKTAIQNMLGVQPGAEVVRLI